MKRVYVYLILILTIAFAVSPAFTTPFSGFSVHQLPIPQIDPPIQPAGYAFSIWGLIYSWLIVSAVFGVKLIQLNLAVVTIPESEFC